ncbi:MAG: DUF4169 family protein [Planktomarina sp.]
MTIINLNKARKTKARAAKVAQADVNAVAFGRTKAEKQAAAQVSTLADAKLDQAKLDPCTDAPKSDH